MSFSIQRAVSDGSMVLLPISIEYFDRSEISVLFDGVVDARQWAWVGTTDTSISFTPAVANLVEVSVRRSTDISEPRHQFSQGAQFTTESLDEDIRQVLHIAQEAKEGSGLGEVYQDLNFHGFKATNMGNGSLPGDAVNHAQMQVHDATIVGYKDAAQASAVAAAASAASVPSVTGGADTVLVINPTNDGWLYKTAAQMRAFLGLGTAAQSNTGDFQPADDDIPTVAASQAEMEAGTEVGLRSMSPLRVRQAINAANPTSMVRLSTANGYGSTNTKIRRFTTVVTNQGADITYADSATLGATFTINTSGMYAISYNDSFTVGSNSGISLNSSQLTTSVASIAAADVIAQATNTANAASAVSASTLYLTAGSVVRAHTAGDSTGAVVAQFTICRVA